MRSARVLKRGSFIYFVSLSVFIGTCWLSFCQASEPKGKYDYFLSNYSKIRQPEQKLHFIVYDTATYFGLSDAEKVDLLELLAPVWTKLVTESHGLTNQEGMALKSFLNTAFRDTLRNYGWTEEEKKVLSELKRLYFDTLRVREDNPVGRELRAAWAGHVKNVRLGEEAKRAMEKEAELRDPYAQQRKEKQKLQEELLARRQDPVYQKAKRDSIEAAWLQRLEEQTKATNVKLSEAGGQKRCRFEQW